MQPKYLYNGDFILNNLDIVSILQDKILMVNFEQKYITQTMCARDDYNGF